MLLGKPYSFLSEAATQDLMDPATSDEVKDTVEELEDVLTNNVEEVKPSDMVTNGGVPVTTAESAILVEGVNGGYYVAIEAVISICEDEAAEDPAADTDVDGEPTADAVAEKAPDVIDQIAQANGVEPEDITVVINSESALFICESAINESKASKGKKKGGKAVKKAQVLTKVADALKGKVQLFKGKKKK